MAGLLQIMHDSHTVPDYEHLLEIQLKNEGHIIPIKIFSDSSGFFVREDLTGQIPAGSKLLDIAGIPLDTLFNEAIKFSCSEGNSPVGKKRIAEAVFYEVLGLVMPVERINTIQYIPCRSDTIHSIEYRALNTKEYRTLDVVRFHKSSKANNRLYNLKLDRGNNLGILKVGSFAPSDNKKFKSFLERSFTLLKKENVENVVIDLRGNTGGNSNYVELLMSYLVQAGYNTPHNIIARQSEIARGRTYKFYRGFTRLFINTFYRNNEDVQGFLTAMKLEDGDMDTIFFSTPTIQKKSIVFSGKKFLMIDGLTASAGVDFTHAFGKLKLGTIVGEPCLGPATGTWGNPAPYQLPITGLKMYIATIRYNYDNSFRYATTAIAPDIFLQPTPCDFLEKRDVVLEAVKKLSIDHMQ